MHKYLELSVDLAREALRHGSAAVGAVILGADGRVIAVGRNRSRDDDDPARVGMASIAHAEIDALHAAGHFDPKGCVLISSIEPCPMCACAAALTGIQHVVFAAHDPGGGAGQVLGWDRCSLLTAIKIEAAPDAKLETIAARLFAPEARTIYRGEGWQRWRRIYPDETDGVTQPA